MSTVKTTCDEQLTTAPSLIAASIFLDIFNVFLLGGERD
jgi:hypothetical protein